MAGLSDLNEDEAATAKEVPMGPPDAPLFGTSLTPKGDNSVWGYRWTVVAICVAVVGLNILVGDRYVGTAEWTEVFIGGTGLAIAVFWTRRKAFWFWPAVSLLVALHLTALVLSYRQALPPIPTGPMAMRGAFALDLGISAFVLYLAHRLFDPRPPGWTRMANIIWWTVILANLAIIGFVAFVLIQHKA